MRRRETESWFFEIGAEPDLMAEELHPSRPKIARGNHWEPKIDLFESKLAIYLIVEIAGVKAEDMEVILQPDEKILILRGTRIESKRGNDKRVPHQLEIFYGGFERVIQLPDAQMNPENMSAQYKNGVLCIEISKL